MQTKERKVFALKNRGIPRVSQFGHYKYNSVRPGLKDHIHFKTLEICYFLKGKQFYAINEALYELRGNDILIIAPDTAHSTGMYPEDKGELYWLQISLEQKKGPLCHLPAEQSDVLLQSLIRNSHLAFKGSLKLKSILKKLELELQKPQSVLGELRTNQLLLQLLLNTHTIAENQGKAPPTDRVKLIDDFIQEHMERTIFVDELASLVDLSLTYFKEWFKKQKGIPPKEYINRLKIDRAKSELLSKHTITQVAFDLGYGSSQYFSTSFKKYTGVTPRSYIAATRHNT